MSSGLLSISCQKEGDEEKIAEMGGKAIVFFPREDKVTAQSIAKFMTKLNESNVYHCIIIVKGVLTPQALKAKDEFTSVMQFEIFHEQELYVDITEHELVPPHSIMTDEQKKELLKRYRIKETQLPKIRRDDAVARYMGLRAGQVVKIVRASETAGRYVTYRVCV